MTTYTPELLSEIFKYHPPTTDERKQKHETCNRVTMEFAICCVPEDAASATWTGLRPGLKKAQQICLETLAKLVQPSVFLERAGRELDSALLYAVDGLTTEAIMSVQVARMLINQAITYESLGINL
jgi:hypothetical protein